MIKPILWDRKYTWSEWRIKHRNSVLTESDAQQLYKTEHQMYDLYEQELIQLRERRVTDYIQDLSLQQSTIQQALNYGGVVGPEALGQLPESQRSNSGGGNIQTFNTPGTFSVKVPKLPYGYIPYNQVIVEAVGGGGVGTRGKTAFSPSAIWIGAGGGGGAYSKKTHSITQNSSISVTVGAGSSTHEVNGGDSTATVDGVTITAGGGKSLVITNEDVNGDAVVFSEIEGPALGGVASGGDINTNGNDGEPGAARANTGSPPPPISGPPDGKGDGGAGAGPFGGAGGITSKYKTILGGQPDNNGGYTDDYAKATNGQQPGGGGGGGGPRNSLYYNYPLTPGNGGDGRVVVTFGYS